MRYFAVLFFICASYFATAQVVPITFDPTDSLITTIDKEISSIHQIDIQNETQSELSLSWRLIETVIPESWTVELCDNSSCYATIPPNENFWPITTDKAFLKLTVLPNGTEDELRMTFRVFKMGEPDDFELVHFNLISSGSSNNQDVETTNINIYPNPATDFITIENLEQFDFATILSMTGQIIARIPSNQKINVSSLADGRYILGIQTGSETIYKAFIKN